MRKVIYVLILLFFTNYGFSQKQEVTTPELSVDFENPFQKFTKKIKFKKNTNTLKENYQFEINSIVKLISVVKENNVLFEIQAHTDNSSNQTNSKKLSQKRADKIRDILISLGCNAKSLKSIGYGSSQPINSNETKEGRDNNDRIEIVLTINN
ncbi:OmpA family protein [Pontimicrobium sp. IMCC45349]|uniref:OmpA family protein n=1 Tax=Pontimicrobium sp. IMCC45349 TaxID=3391574 RepID=UPI0039A106A7